MVISVQGVIKNSAYTEEFIGAPASGCVMHFNIEVGLCVCVRACALAYIYSYD